MVAGLLLIGFVTIPALVDQVRELTDSAPGMQQQLAERLSHSHLTLPIANAVRRAKLQEILIPSEQAGVRVSSRAVELLGWGADHAGAGVLHPGRSVVDAGGPLRGRPAPISHPPGAHHC